MLKSVRKLPDYSIKPYIYKIFKKIFIYTYINMTLKKKIVELEEQIKKLEESNKLKTELCNNAFGFIRHLGLGQLFSQSIENGNIDLLEVKEVMDKLFAFINTD